MDKVVVSVIIPTYNHEQLIEQAIESALRQECNFPFEVIIGNDCSTDRTGELCERYTGQPGVKLLSHPENLGLLKNYRTLFSECAGKYIAILEGDDFWEKNKLAEQIAFLEANPEYGFIHSNAFLQFDHKHKTLHDHTLASSGEFTYRDIFTDNRIAAVTVCFRKELLQHADLDRFESLNFKTIDLPLWLEFSQHGRLAYINKSLATFRISETSISNNRSVQKRKEFEKSNRSILNYYSQKYPMEGLDQLFMDEKFNLKMFYIYLYYGTYSDMKTLRDASIPVSGLKLLATRCWLLFLLYKLFVRIFYNRV